MAPVGKANPDLMDRLMAERGELLKAPRLADAALAGANMNMTVVERKVRAAVDKATGGSND